MSEKKRDKKLMEIIVVRCQSCCGFDVENDTICSGCIGQYEAIIRRVIQMSPKNLPNATTNQYCWAYNRGINDYKRKLKGPAPSGTVKRPKADNKHRGSK